MGTEILGYYCRLPN